MDVMVRAAAATLDNTGKMGSEGSRATRQKEPRSLTFLSYHFRPGC